MTIDRVSDNYFFGAEVENSSAKGMPTLFVVGLQPSAEILDIANKNNIHHIYLGANMSLHDVADNDHVKWRRWDDMFEALLTDPSIEYITVDILSTQIEGFLESTMSEDNRVIPMVSVKLPYIRLLNYNTTVKIDDKGFDKTNPGVWCMPLADLTKRKYFTPWNAYKGDNPVTTKENK
jgi:hypothetical protein